MIYVGGGHISDRLCSYLIHLFESNPQEHERVNHAGQFSKLWLHEYSQICDELTEATVQVIDLSLIHI